MSTIDSVLRHGRDGDTAIAVPDGPSLTYALLRRMVHEAALRLVSFGVQPEDRVAVFNPMSALTRATLVGMAGDVLTAHGGEHKTLPDLRTLYTCVKLLDPHRG